MASKDPPVTADSGCSGESTSEAPRPEAGASNNQPTPGSSRGSTSSAPLAAIHNHKSFTTEPFARYLVIKHSDKDKDIMKYNPYAIQKALCILIGDKFVCTRYERSKFVEIFVRSRNQSETLLNLKQLDCTEYVIPVSVTKHTSKNTCKGVIHCRSIGHASKTELLNDMKTDNVIDIYRLSKTENGVTKPTETYILTFDAETRPNELDMGFGEFIKVLPYYPNPRLCRNCQRYGHGSKYCNNKQICAKCGSEGHDFESCDKDPVCLFCKANHFSSSKNCPMFLLEKRVLKLMTDKNCKQAEARKLVYRDSQDLVAKIPSLSNYVTPSWSHVVSGNPNVIPARQSNTQHQPPTQAPPIDSSTIFDHPSFKALKAEHASTKALLDQMQQQQAAQQKATTDLLAQMQQQQRSNNEQMNMIKNLFGILMSAQSYLPPATLQAIQNLMSQPTQHPQLHLLPNTIHTIETPNNNHQTVSMDTTSSSKRSHSASSEDGIPDNSKKVASDKSSDRQDKSVSAPVPQDKGAQAEQPKTASASAPASVPQNTGAQVGQRKSHLPVQDKPGTRKTDGRGQSDPKGGNKPAVAKKGDSKPVVPIKKPSLSRGVPPGSTSRTDLN